MSDFRQVYDLIKRGEDQQLDFKLRITDIPKIAKTIVAFANTDGGQIVIGISDAGDIKGVDIAQEKHMLIKAARKYCNPVIYLHFKTIAVEGKEILITRIKKSKKQHLAKDENGNWLPYIRIHDQTVLSPDAQFSSNYEHHQLNPIPIISRSNKSLIDFLKKNKSITVKDYMQLMNISYTTARRSLFQLVEAGVLQQITINRAEHFFLGEKD